MNVSLVGTNLLGGHHRGRIGGWVVPCVTSDSACARSANASRSAFQTMKILISNDDGYQAPGIVALHDALKTIADVK